MICAAVGCNDAAAATAGLLLTGLRPPLLTGGANATAATEGADAAVEY